MTEWTGRPELLDYLTKIIRANNIDARDERKLARAVQLLAQRIKYFREYPERWQSPCRTIAWNIGDCDDKTILIATALRSFRIPVRLVFMRFTKETFDGQKMVPVKIAHVYPEAWIENAWHALESVQPLAFGQDPAELMRSKGHQVTREVYGDSPTAMRG